MKKVELFTFTVERTNSIQNALKNSNDVRYVMGLVQSLVAFIGGSPKKLSWFYQFQAVEGDHRLASLRAFCPTLWIMRLISLKAISRHYTQTILWLQVVDEQVRTDAIFFLLFYLPYLSSIHEKANCIAIFWTGRPHSLGSYHFRGVWVTCLSHKGGDVPSALPKDTTSELAGLFSTSSKCQAPSRYKGPKLLYRQALAYPRSYKVTASNQKIADKPVNSAARPAFSIGYRYQHICAEFDNLYSKLLNLIIVTTLNVKIKIYNIVRLLCVQLFS